MAPPCTPPPLEASAPDGDADAPTRLTIASQPRRPASGWREEFRPNEVFDNDIAEGNEAGHFATSFNAGLNFAHTMARALRRRPSSIGHASEAGGSRKHLQDGALSDAASSLDFGLHPEDSPPCAVEPRPIPECFKCPVSQQLMEDPVSLDDGRTCDRSSVSSLGYEGAVRPNVELKEAIGGYLELLDHLEARHQDWLRYTALYQQKQSRRHTQLKKQVFVLRSALERGYRRSEELARDSRNSSKLRAGSSMGSVHSTTDPSSSSTASPGASTTTTSARAEDEEEQLRQQLEQHERERQEFKCGPAPRHPKAVSAAGKHRAPSSWSKFFPDRLAGSGGA